MIGGDHMKKGVDVSTYQGKVDWETAKDYIDFAILRCGFGNDLKKQDDNQYVRNADECTRLKIPFGIYLYSYATNLSMAQSEVEHTLRLLSDYKLEYPVFLDVEDRSQLALPKERLVEVIDYYCKKIEEAGYYVGIYASLSVLNTKLNDTVLNKYDKWVAEWSKNFSYKGASGMWQYTNNGRIPGINTRVDEDKAFYDYPKIIRSAGLNHLEDEEDDDQKELQYKKGDVLYLNGYTYEDEDAKNKKKKKHKNKKVTVTDVSSDKTKAAPYTLDIGGNAKEEDLSVEKDLCIIMKFIKCIMSLFKKKTN